MFTSQHLSKKEIADRQLLDAALYADLPEVAKALRAGADYNAVDAFGNTALHRFGATANVDGIIIMLDAKARVNAVNNKQETPLEMVIHNGGLWGEDAQLAAAKFLLAAGAHVPTAMVAEAVKKNAQPLADYLGSIQHGETAVPNYEDLRSAFDKASGQKSAAATRDRFIKRDSDSCHGR